MMIDALSDLLAVCERFKAMPPIAVAFWCVDSPGMVWRLRAVCCSTTVRREMLQSLPYQDIPIREWYSWLADEADRARRPPCFSTPGVYAEMNNGTYTSLTHD